MIITLVLIPNSGQPPRSVRRQTGIFRRPTVQQDPNHQADDNRENQRHRNAEHAAALQEPSRSIPARFEAFGFVIRNEPSQAAIKRSPQSVTMKA